MTRKAQVRLTDTDKRIEATVRPSLNGMGTNIILFMPLTGLKHHHHCTSCQYFFGECNKISVLTNGAMTFPRPNGVMELRYPGRSTEEIEKIIHNWISASADCMKSKEMAKLEQQTLAHAIASNQNQI